MKALVVFDSTWGNTEQIAHAVAAGIGGGAKVVRVGDAEAKRLDALDLLVLGSPILGGRPSPSMHGYITSIAQETARNLQVATFDTRLMMRFAKIFGYAAVRMAALLKDKGCSLKSTEGFFVKGRSGPLADGELARATEWGKRLSKGEERSVDGHLESHHS
jgi:flavodoxin I